MAYEKGFALLYYLEQVVGGPVKFDAFLKEYFSTFAYKTLTTADFKNFFIAFFKDVKELEKVDWDAWLYVGGGG